MAETRVRVVITGDSRQAQSAVQRLQREFSGLGDSAATLNRTLAGLGVGLSVGALVSAFRGAVTELDEFNDAAEKTGISVEKLSGLVEELAPAGVSLQQITDLAGKMTRAMSGAEDETAGAAEAFRALNVETKDAQGNLRPVDDVLRDVARSLAQYADGSNKTAILQKLLGKSGADLLPVFNDIAETTGKVGSVTAEAAKQAEEMQRQFNAIGRVALDLRNALVGALVPGLLNVAEQFRAVQAAANGSITDMIRFGLQSPMGAAGKINEVLAERAKILARIRREEADTPVNADTARRQEFNLAKLRGELDRAERQLTFLRTLQGQVERNEAPAATVAGEFMGPPVPVRPQAPRLTGEADRASAKARQEEDKKEAQAVLRELAESQRKADEATAAAISEATKSEQEDLRAIARLTADAREDRERLVKTYRDLLDPLEQYRQKLQEITRLEGLGSEYGLSSDDAQRAREVVLEQMDRAGSDVRDFRDTTAGAFGDLQRSIEAWSDRSADAITEFVTTGKGGFKGMVDAILADLLRLQIQKTVTGPLRDSLPGLFGSVIGAFLGGSGTGILEGDSALALTGADIRARRAGGGDMKGGYPYLVGERGTPEIVIPRTDSTAIPYELLRAAIYEKNVGSSSASSQPVVVNQVLNVGQGADFAMVRQAAALGAAQAQAEFVEARRRGQRWAS